MRLWHLLFGVAGASVVLTLARDEVGRVAVVVFTVGLGECALGVASLMALFQAVGALGQARGLAAHASALASTALVLAAGSAVMLAWLFVGAWLLVLSLG